MDNVFKFTISQCNNYSLHKNKETHNLENSQWIIQEIILIIVDLRTEGMKFVDVDILLSKWCITSNKDLKLLFL